MIISGVRSTAARPAMSKREVRSRVKAFSNWTSPVAADPAPIEELIAVADSVPSLPEDPAAGVAPPIDWSRPFG